MDIPTKNQLIKDLRISYSGITNWINEQPSDHFNKEILTGKWTIAGHLYHLEKSTRAVCKGMGMPKLILRSMFGENNRTERTFEEAKTKYEKGLVEIVVTVPDDYEAEKGRIFDKIELLRRFDAGLNNLILVIGKWNEKDMGKYVLPHPVFGKFTIREFIYFTIFHTDHHLEILKEKYSEQVILE